jgi:hypothetical protein
VTRASITNIIWKNRFDRTFDQVPGIPIFGVKQKYAYRCDVSKKWTCFDLGRFGGMIDDECREVQSENQQDCLEMLRGLILGKRLGQSQVKMVILTLLLQNRMPARHMMTRETKLSMA